MNVLIYGNSELLIEAITLAFPNDTIRKIKWRESTEQSFINDFDILFIVGYDYNSYNINFRKYFNVNVRKPLKIIGTIKNKSVDIIFIQTQKEKVKFTLSRYRFAKEIFGYKLRENFANSYILRFNTFIDQNNNISIDGGLTEKILFNAFRKIKLIKTESFDSIVEKLSDYKKYNSEEFIKIKAFFLYTKRTQFIDRILRISIG